MVWPFASRWAMTWVLAAVAGCTRPLPPSARLNPLNREGSPVLARAAFHWGTVQVGCACLTSAAEPATCGAAIEVPERIRDPVAVPMPAETMLTPGAVRSGLRALSSFLGPPELKLANWV